MRLTPSITARLADPEAEKARRNHDQRIGELQGLPATALRTIAGVVLPDGTEVTVPHGLGRAPRAVITSPVRAAAGTTAGAIFEYRGVGGLSGSPIDSSSVIVLAAFGFTNSITVDVVVM